MSQENVEVVQRAFSLVDQGNIVEFIGSQDEASLQAMVESVYTPDVEIQWLASNPDVSDVYRGHDGAVRAFTEWLAVWEEFSIEVLEFVDAGEAVIVPNIQRGTGITSGASTELRTAFVCTVRNGKISRLLEAPTKKAALEAAGLSE